MQQQCLSELCDKTRSFVTFVSFRNFSCQNYGNNAVLIRTARDLIAFSCCLDIDWRGGNKKGPHVSRRVRISLRWCSNLRGVVGRNQCLVRAVAEDAGLALLASAEVLGLGLVGHIRRGSKGRAVLLVERLVAAIAERLVLAGTARAEVVSLAFLDQHAIRALLRYARLRLDVVGRSVRSTLRRHLLCLLWCILRGGLCTNLWALIVL